MPEDSDYQCPDCGSEDNGRNIITDPPGHLRCADCENVWRPEDPRSLRTRAVEELGHGVAFTILGYIGVTRIGGTHLPDGSLYVALGMTGLFVSVCALLAGVIRVIDGIECSIALLRGETDV